MPERFRPFFVLGSLQRSDIIETLKFTLYGLVVDMHGRWWFPGYIALLIAPNSYEFRVLTLRDGSDISIKWHEFLDCDGRRPIFMSVLKVFPVPTEWQTRAVSDYVDAHVEEWTDKLCRHMLKQLNDVLTPFDKELNDIEDAIYCGPTHENEKVRHYPPPTNVVYPEFWVKSVLVEHVPANSDVMLLKRERHYVLGLLQPVRLADHGKDSAYSLPFVMLNTAETPLGIDDGERFCAGAWYRILEKNGLENGRQLVPTNRGRGGMLMLDIPPSLIDKLGERLDFDVYDKTENLRWRDPSGVSDWDAGAAC